MTAPTQQSQSWRCTRCGRKIGEVLGEVVDIRTCERRITAHLPCSQMCPKCQAVNVKGV